MAHDFNNLLMVIIGYAEMALISLSPNDPLWKDITEIQSAANRAADLTRQLLAFSRKQTLQPKVLNLNALITNLEKMLKRMLGEDIEFNLSLEKKLWMVKVDPGQIEQVIVNLVVNARDAMPRGGKFFIETRKAVLDRKYAKSHPVVIPGDYVMLAISDNGCGMTAEVKAKIFDPFFTTKTKEKGTGLGLSTVYGIIKQSNGYIWFYSEEGKGTSFKIYLPRVVEEADEFVRKEAVPGMPRGNETLFVVEDEDGVRNLACNVLKQQG
ncbi:Sensor kinase CckA [subsurface metagenome]